MTGLKVCSTCSTEKEIDSFYSCLSKWDSLQTSCKDCQYKKGLSERGRRASRKSKLKTQYNLTEDEYLVLLHKQQGHCAICYQTTGLEIDHDHRTGKVRGLLCRFCNRGLGFFKDEPNHLVNAVKYLEG